MKPLRKGTIVGFEVPAGKLKGKIVDCQIVDIGNDGTYRLQPTRHKQEIGPRHLTNVSADRIRPAESQTA